MIDRFLGAFSENRVAAEQFCIFYGPVLLNEYLQADVPLYAFVFEDLGVLHWHLLENFVVGVLRVAG